MTKDRQRLIVLTAGGTGGHVYPADALATELEKRGYEVMLFTDGRGLHNYKGKLGEIENKAIYSGSVVGKSPVTKICSLFKVGCGVIQAAYYLLRRRPVCVVGFGGYASFPTAVAAVILRIPLVIHEQNSVMSRTNRILARFATLAAQSFRQVKNTPAGIKTILSGMPIRNTIAALHGQPRPEKQPGDKLTLLVLGGSQGAKIFAEAVPQAVMMLDEQLRRSLVIYQQCRQGEESAVTAQYENSGCQVTIRAFFDNMPELYRLADLIISRAGASSVYEIAAAGLPSVLVPLPIAADNHQFYNALEFAEAGAGIVVEQKDFTPQKLRDILQDLLLQPQKRAQMAAKAGEIAIVDAAARLADGIEELMIKEKNDVRAGKR